MSTGVYASDSNSTHTFQRFITHSINYSLLNTTDEQGFDMRADGYTGQYVGFDFAPAVIEQLNTQRGELPESVTFQVQDARDLPYEDQSYDCVIDKGTIDAMLCQDDGAFVVLYMCNYA
jgi:23S rRNA G2445 N2-methylase RlmL